jgi:hypothetical protein
VAALAAAAIAVSGGCRRGAPAEPLVTYYNAEHALSLRYPASWTSDQARQGDVWYRYFQAPPTGEDRKPAATVTLIAGVLGSSLDEYAQKYLAGQTVSQTHEETRPGARGKSWRAVSPDSTTRHHLLLLQEEGRVYGLHAQGPAAGFREQEANIAAVLDSFTLERWALYVEDHNPAYRYAIRVPPSWKATRSFSGGGTYLKQYTSPPFVIDKGGQTVHASLTITAESVAAGTSAESFYLAAKAKMGESFQLLSHSPWKDGYVDLLRTETPMAESRGKRYYRVSEGRGYTLAFEARADAYPRVSRWCDMIAASLRTGPELDHK